MNLKEKEDLLKEKGALMEGHFILTSGQHGDTYIQCARILEDPQTSALLIGELIKEVKNKNIDLVIGPATGGIILAYEAARQLGVKAIFTERENGEMTLRRGFKIPKGARILVVEDVVTTGGSVKEVLNIVENQGGQVAAVGLIADRTGGKIDFGVPTYAIFSKEINSYNPRDCYLCKENIPASKLGSRNLNSL